MPVDVQPFDILQPGAGPIRAAQYLPATPDTVLWGRLPCATDLPVMAVGSGTVVTIEIPFRWLTKP